MLAHFFRKRRSKVTQIIVIATEIGSRMGFQVLFNQTVAICLFVFLKVPYLKFLFGYCISSFFSTFLLCMNVIHFVC